ncbi:MAG: protein-glutamate O-methyltransferase CheR [Ruminococcus sp.]|nr:protein-glutamate O-methyltransferase CheR [Ruminococcus sp.]MCM1381556.1 protein-glutamate O-methyltransferase CheR [Muribaculaceae bacterium]MCM1479373.1 protein-glutamate O-methyltransferase CheR [Muribaculaceae bacterium]
MLKLTDQDFERLMTYMKKTYGINLEKKRVLIEGRLSNMISARGFTSFKDYIDFAFADKTGNETMQLVNKLTTNHTFFMREPEHFEFLKKVILPYLETKNAATKVLDLWCAASSTGQEPYTIVMTIDEYFGPNAARWKVNLLATDLDTDVLAKAKAGVYTVDMLKDVPSKWMDKYFTKVDANTYKVIDRLRNQITFRQFNLMKPIVDRKLYDLISCRNVMIYFEPETKNELVERFYDVTKEGGYLFTGHAESVGRNTRYTYIQPAVYRRLKDGVDANGRIAPMISR